MIGFDPFKPERPEPDAGADESLVAEVRALMDQGKKIHAIKLYRERTGTGLAVAKDAVEAIERGQALRRSSHEIEAELIPLLEQGEKIKAIKLFRDRTGAGLKEAKDAVEAIERGEPTRRTPAEIETELAPLLKQGEKIKAIKLFRDRTGAGLKEAKDAVEALEPRYPRQMHCPNCGARAEPADAACHACGARLARPGVGCAWWWVAIVAAAAGLAASLYAASFFK